MARRTLLISRIPPNASEEEVQKSLSFGFDTFIDMMPLGSASTKKAYLTFWSEMHCDAARALANAFQNHIIEGQLLDVDYASYYIVPIDSGFASEDEVESDDELDGSNDEIDIDDENHANENENHDDMSTNDNTDVGGSVGGSG